ncbi:hypothetical protein FOZ63_010460, partial [Perkinsus olseni]
LELRYDKLNERTAREIALSRISEGLLSQIGSSDSEDETRKSPRAALRSSTAHHRDALPPPPPPRKSPVSEYEAYIEIAPETEWRQLYVASMAPPSTSVETTAGLGQVKLGLFDDDSYRVLPVS